MSEEWKSHSIPLAELEREGDKQADLSDVTSLLFVKGTLDLSGKHLELRRVYFTRD